MGSDGEESRLVRLPADVADALAAYREESELTQAEAARRIVETGLEELDDPDAASGTGPDAADGITDIAEEVEGRDPGRRIEPDDIDEETAWTDADEGADRDDADQDDVVRDDADDPLGTSPEPEREPDRTGTGGRRWTYIGGALFVVGLGATLGYGSLAAAGESYFGADPTVGVLLGGVVSLVGLAILVGFGLSAAVGRTRNAQRV